MPYINDEHANEVSESTVFAYVQRRLTAMLDDLPAKTPERLVLEAAIEQLTVRLAFAQSPEIAARHLAGTNRLLKVGGLRM